MNMSTTSTTSPKTKSTSATSAALKGRSADLSCLFGEKKCADPIDALVAGFGIDRVVLIRGGQDESGFHFKVVSYRPKTAESTPAEATATALDRALLGALVKVTPLAATLDVRSTPPGARGYRRARLASRSTRGRSPSAPDRRTTSLHLRT